LFNEKPISRPFLCQRSALTTPTGNFGIAVNATTVFWTSEDGTVHSVPIAGGAVTTLATGQNDAVGLRVGGGVVYWTNDQVGGVTMVSTSGGSPIVLAPAGINSSGIAVDGNTVYWTDEVSGTVNEVSIAGGAPTVLATGQALPSEIVVDATNIYWLNSASNGAVMKLAK